MPHPARRRPGRVLWLLALALAAAGGARAANYTWTGAASNAWNANANWQGLAAPPSNGLASSDLFFNASTRAALNLGGATYSIRSLTFGSTAVAHSFNAGALTLGTGGLTQSGAANQAFDVPVTLGGNSTFTISATGTGGVFFGAGLSLGSFALQINAAGSSSLGGVISGTGSFTKAGAGTLTLTGASTFTGATAVNEGTLAFTAGGLTASLVGVAAGAQLVVSGTANLAGTNDSYVVIDGSPTNPATLTVTGGSIDLNGGFIGASGAGILQQSGGTVLSSSGTFAQVIGGAASSTGTYNLSGGSYQGAGSIRIGNAGTGVVHQTGGLFSTDLVSLGTEAGSRGTYNLDGGILSVRAINRGSGAGTLNFNGGVYRAPTATANLNPNTINIRAGGAGIDTNGFDLTIPQPLLHSTLPGDQATDGGLTKLGTGTLTLTGANTFTGGVTVQAGTLRAANASFFGAGPITLAESGALVFTDSSVDLSHRKITLGAASVLQPPAGGTLTYASTTVSGGQLGAGSHTLGSAVNLNGTRTTAGFLVAAGNSVVVENFTLGGNATLTQASGSIVSAGEFIATPQTTLTVGGTVTVAGAYLSGLVTVQNGGRLRTAAAPLYLDGSRGVTVASGGELTATSDATIELGGLLTNHGRQGGVLNVNLGGIVRGSGTFDTVHLLADSAFSAAGVVGGMLTIDHGASVALSGAGQTLTVAGPLVNNGVLRFDRGAALHVTSGAGNFVNTGTIDVISGSANLPAGFINQGVILDRSVVRVKAIARAPGGASVSVQIDGYPGHSYQLQRASSLTAGFTNAPNVPAQSVPASDGAAVTLTFQDANPPAGEAFYRVQVDA